MAEHSAVNRRVVGSSPTCGAKFPSKYEDEATSLEWPSVFCDVDCDITPWSLFRFTSCSRKSNKEDRSHVEG